jgi:hypothetical protein
VEPWAGKNFATWFANRELESFLDGSRRKITVKSIQAYIQRKLEETEQKAA